MRGGNVVLASALWLAMVTSESACDRHAPRAMDAALAVANERRLTAPKVVLVSERDRPQKASFTIFYQRGLVSVLVDLDTDVVTEKKL